MTICASRYFALPSRVQISPDAQIVTLHRIAQVVAFNSLLPCGARLLRADRRGRFVNALFLLANRPDSPCDAPGASARVAFVVRGGLIREWYRAPSEPSDPGNPPVIPATPGVPAAPGSPVSPGTPVTPGAPVTPDQQTPTTPDQPVPGAPAAGPIV